MKKIILLFLLFCAAMIHAQTSIPNGGFENWTTLSYSNPTSYPVTANNDGVEKGGIFPVTKTTGYHGNYGVQVKSTAEVGLGFFINTNPNGQDPSTWHGGIPYAQIPTGIRGYYKYNVASGDMGGMFVVFSKNGNNIGTYNIPLGGLHNDYALFDVTFSPALTQTPDSVILGFASSWPNPITGSTLVIDSVSFKGVTAQPALMNGDFEQWNDFTIDNLTSWYNNNQGHTDAVVKTTDAYKGSFAVELKTYMGEENHQPKVQAAQLMTGYYPDCPTGNCYPQGGYPFAKQSDALEFYYKYIPAGTDQAQVSLYFKKKNSGMDGWYAGMQLPPATQYTHVSVPFNLPFVPDSVIIQFQSSDWSSISSTNVGSSLKIDEVIFTSQKNDVTKTLNLSSAGTLSTVLTTTELNTLTGLTLTGVIDARDFKTMRDLMPVLNSINLTGANIVAYTGTAGTYNTTNYTYPANTIPRNGLLNKTIMQNLSLPNTLTVIGRSGLNGCTSLNNLTIPSTVNAIDTLALRRTIALKQITIPSSVKEIRYGAFLQSGLQVLNLNEGLQKIGDYTFQNCDSLTSISIPSTVVRIGYCALTFMNELKEINVSTNNQYFTSFNGVLLDKAKQRLLAYPAEKSYHYDIPQGILVIDTAAFEGNWKLRSVTIPASVTKLAPETFYWCGRLTAINIPATVNKIGAYSFYHCSRLSAVFVNTPTPLGINVSDSIFKYVNDGGCTLYVPKGSVANYQASAGWYEYIKRIHEYETVTDNEGNIYHAIQIGTQMWMVENLRTKHFNNNDLIPTTSYLDVDLTPDPAAKFNWAPSYDESNNYLYGRVYTWNVTADSRGICPQGWKIPNRTDWETLFNTVKSTSNYVNKYLAASSAWIEDASIVPNSPSDVQPTNNSSGFLAYPAGVRHTWGTYEGYWYTCYYWTSELQNDLAYAYNIDFDKTDINSGAYRKQEGFSIRCVKNIGTGIGYIQTSQFNISPNPTDKGFYIDKGLAANGIIITDMRGVEVLNEKNPADYVDVSTFPNGVYIVRLLSDDRIYLGKLIKK